MLVWSLLLACAPSDGPSDAALATLVDQVLVASGLTEADVLVHEMSSNPDATTFLVDQDPDAAWGHAVTVVAVGPDGQISSEDRSDVPLVAGEPFVPEWEPAAWGVDHQPIDPEDLDDEAFFPDWDLGESRRAAPPDPGECETELKKRAVTIAGGQLTSSKQDELQWRRLLKQRDYTVEFQRPTRWDPVTKAEATLAIGEAVGDEPLEELVVLWAGHGVPWSGHWAFGQSDLDPDEVMTSIDIFEALAGVDAQRVVVVLLSCQAGYVAEDLVKLATQDEAWADTELVVMAASEGGTQAWVEAERPWGSAYGRSLHALAAATPAGEDIPWTDFDLAPFEVVTRVGTKTQTPTMAVKDARPRITLDVYPYDGTCQAAWLDRGDADFDPTQDYTRDTALYGTGFGEAGAVEMQDVDGEWTFVPEAYRAPDRIAFHLPMRSDGFPAMGMSPDAAERLVELGHLGLGDTPDPGTYLVRVVRTDLEEMQTSDPMPVKLESQVHEQLWVPSSIPPDPFPDWMELWHPFTPASQWTQGPTIQLDHLWNGTRENSPIPADPSGLNAAEDVELTHSTRIESVGAWVVDLHGLRDERAYQQELPEFTYWGVRVVFADDDVSADTWGYTVIYD